MARKTVTLDECEAAAARLSKATETDLSVTCDDGKFRLFTMHEGKPMFLGARSMSGSAFVNSVNFAADLLAFLDDDDDDEAPEATETE